MKYQEEEIKRLEEELLFSPKNGYNRLTEQQQEEAYDFCEEYKAFLSQVKTERETVAQAIAIAEENGFVPFEEGTLYPPGAKVYVNNRGKSLILAVIGSKPFGDGCKFLAAHADTPHLDLKPTPLYEQNEIALFKTHYYGGIKKYQWAAIPLSLRGVVMKENGETVNISIGDKEGDPVICVNDLLPHLASEQMKRTGNDLIKGEELNAMVGSKPLCADEGKDLVKLNILNILREEYGITERDLISSELQIVPACGGCDVGLDRSMVGGYGQDDRVCAYTALQAILDCQTPENTAVVVLSDKEETGSDGATGMKSDFLNYFIESLAEVYGAKGRNVWENSACLSADVHAAYDPTFSDVYDPHSSIYANFGVGVAKYTGSRGKGGTSDASAEFLNQVTRLFDKEGIPWQIGEYGKVDVGGGGTIAMYLAKKNMNVLDVGTPVLSMHAPFEVTAKADVYSTYLAYRAFIGGNR